MVTDLLIACGIVVVAVAWHGSLAARECANSLASDLCARRSLSLLDDTVALAKMQVVRRASGHLTIRRTYTFDYCEDGVSRASGFVILIGHQLEAAGLASIDVRSS